jgi:hypothetical protein
MVNFLMAQTTITIADSATKKSISYATIECYKYKWGIFANEFGVAELPSFIVVGDTLQISRVGYYKQQIVVAKPLYTILLATKILEAVTVESCKEREIIKTNIEADNGMYLSFTGPQSFEKNQSWLLFIENVNNKLGYIDKIEFYATSFGNRKLLNAAVRLMVFDFDKSTKQVGEEIISDFILIQPYKSGKNVIDISSYKIPFDKNGVVIGFERYVTDKKYIDSSYSKQEKKFYYGYGWSVKATPTKKYLTFVKVSGSKNFSHGIGRGPAINLYVSYCK